MEDDDFTWDDKKDKINKGLGRPGFDEVRKMWDDPKRILKDGKIKDKEKRFLLISKIDGKLWVCVYTIRNDKRRIISFRRAAKKYQRMYHEQI